MGGCVSVGEHQNKTLRFHKKIGVPSPPPAAATPIPITSGAPIKQTISEPADNSADVQPEAVLANVPLPKQAVDINAPPPNSKPTLISEIPEAEEDSDSASSGMRSFAEVKKQLIRQEPARKKKKKKKDDRLSSPSISEGEVVESVIIGGNNDPDEDTGSFIVPSGRTVSPTAEQERAIAMRQQRKNAMQLNRAELSKITEVNSMADSLRMQESYRLSGFKQLEKSRLPPGSMNIPREKQTMREEDYAYTSHIVPVVRLTIGQ